MEAEKWQALSIHAKIRNHWGGLGVRIVREFGRIQAVFVDRDGTIGGTGHFVHPRDFQLFPNAQAAIDLLKKQGVKVFALTNQHRISLEEA